MKDDLFKILSPKSMCIIYLGINVLKIKTVTNLKDLILNWTREMPSELHSEFAIAIDEIENIRNNQIVNIFNYLHYYQAPLIDFFNQQMLREYNPEQIKEEGTVLTPSWLTYRVTQNLLKHWKRIHRSGKQPNNIADLSCGSGAFLFSVENIFGSAPHIVGVDKSSIAFNYTSLLKWAYNFNWEVRKEDSLFQSVHIKDLFPQTKNFNNIEYDIILGNPPYVRSSIIDQLYLKDIKREYVSTAKGNFDLSIAFIEHAIRNLKQDGIASYILSNKFMTMGYGKRICSELANRVRVINIEDFQDFQIFPGYTTYTCVLTFTKKTPAKRFSITRFPQGIEQGKDPGKGDSATLPLERLKVHPWDFAVGPIHEVLRILRDPKNPLITDIFLSVQQGIRTGSNDVFIIKGKDLIKLEADCLLSFVGGEQIRPCKLDADQLKLIFPYTINAENIVRPISETDLIDLYPKTYNYLLSHCNKLKDRKLNENLPWYSFSRTQNMTFFMKPKLLVKEMMPKAEFAADLKGEIAFCSGYGLDASNLSESELKMWTAIFCTSTMEFLFRHNGTQLHSGWFRILKQHIVRTRLPLFDKESKSKAIKFSELFYSNFNIKYLNELDNIVASSFGLKSKHREMITTFLRDCHKRSIPNGAESRLKPKKVVASKEARSKFEPVILKRYEKYHVERLDLKQLVTFRQNKNEPIHSWYQFTQGFSSKLVNILIEELGVTTDDLVLDPFAGCGTTLLACKQKGINSKGIEISPFLSWITKGKTYNWRPNELKKFLDNIEPPKTIKTKSYSTFFDSYLRKAFSHDILAQINTYAFYFNNSDYPERMKRFLLLGLISILEEISQIRKHGSHYRYMLKDENIGLQKLNINIINPDENIWPILKQRLQKMLNDIILTHRKDNVGKCNIYCSDARDIKIKNDSVNSIITSPPYLNRNNYIAQQKAELSLLSFVSSKEEYESLVKRTFRSHTDCKYDTLPETSFKEVKKILNAIEISDNNNPKIPHMIAGYFEDLSKVLQELYRVLKPGGAAAFVVANSRWGGIVVPLDHLLFKISELHGFIPEKLIITRMKGNSPQQMKRYGKIAVRESIVIFKKPS